MISLITMPSLSDLHNLVQTLDARLVLLDQATVEPEQEAEHAAKRIEVEEKRRRVLAEIADRTSSGRLPYPEADR